MDLATKVAVFFIVISSVAILFYFFKPKDDNKLKKKQREKRPKEILWQNLVDIYPEVVSSFEINIFINEWGIDEVKKNLDLLKKEGYVKTQFIRQGGKLRGSGYKLTKTGLKYATKYLEMKKNSEY